MTVKPKAENRAPADPETSSHIPIHALYTPADLKARDQEGKSDTPANIPLPAACRPPCTAAGSGPCASTPAWATPRNPTSATSICWPTAPPASRSPSICPRRSASIPTIPLALGEVGKVGVAIDSIEDMERLFDGIDLTKISTSMTINATASILLALYVAVARRQGADIRKLSGTVQNDVLKEYIARGTYIYPPAQAMRIITDMFAWANENVPEWNTISISGYHMREAGSTAVQEVAFTLANGMAYVQAAIDAGLDVDKFAPRLSFFFNAHNNFLEEVAKFRAARRMWARIMREHFKAKNPRSWMLRFHTQTAGSTLTAQQPENNIVRTALQALAAVLGGTQSLHTNSYDEALALPTEQAARIALRTQQIIAYESGRAADRRSPWPARTTSRP